MTSKPGTVSRSSYLEQSVSMDKNSDYDATGFSFDCQPPNVDISKCANVVNLPQLKSNLATTKTQARGN